jgi:hypothetical protein
MNVKLDKRGAAGTAIAVGLVSAYQALYFVAPEFLAIPLWDGSHLTVAFLLGTLSVALPVGVGWWMIRGDKGDGEVFDVTHR